MNRTTTHPGPGKGPISSDTGRFAMVPIWVLDALLAHPARAANAALLYARLSAEADYGTHGDLTISQADLAALVGVSVDTLGRSLAVLREVGAVTWQPTGRAATYTVHRARYRTGAETDSAQPSGTSTRTGAETDSADRPRIPITPKGARTSQKKTPLPPGESGDLEHHQPDPFDAFWTAYPRKVGKPAAQRAWRTIPAGDHQAVAAGLGAWCRYWADRGQPEFIPYPATWLNQHRWNDTPPPVSTRPAGTVQSTVDTAHAVLATIRERTDHARAEIDAATSQVRAALEVVAR